MAMRKLLFHLGIDDSVGTYTTDYVSGLLAIIFAVITTALARKLKHLQDRNEEENHKKKTAINLICSRLISLTMIFYTSSGMLLFGGIVHQLVTEVAHKQSSDLLEDLRMYKKEFTSLYLLWQIASFSGSTMALFIIVYAINLLVFHAHNLPEEENNCMRRIFSIRHDKYITSVLVTTVTIGQLIWRSISIYEYIISANDPSRDPTVEAYILKEEIERYRTDSLLSIWACDISYLLLLLSVLFYVSVTIYLWFKRNFDYDRRKATAVDDNRSDYDETIAPVNNDINDTNTSNCHLLPENITCQSKSTLHRIQHRIPQQCVAYLRMLSSLTMLISGGIQYLLGTKCTDHNSESCPLPDSFNHNAIFHLMLGAALSGLFVSEFIFTINFMERSKSAKRMYFV